MHIHAHHTVFDMTFILAGSRTRQGINALAKVAPGEPGCTRAIMCIQSR